MQGDCHVEDDYFSFRSRVVHDRDGGSRRGVWLFGQIRERGNQKGQAQSRQVEGRQVTQIAEGLARLLGGLFEHAGYQAADLRWTRGVANPA